MFLTNAESNLTYVSFFFYILFKSSSVLSSDFLKKDFPSTFLDSFFVLLKYESLISDALTPSILILVDVAMQ